MKKIYKDFLFTKHYFVNETGESDDAFDTLFSLANLFGIKVTSNQKYATSDMIEFAESQLDVIVPQPFYKSFPASVRQLSADQLLFDQLVHYYMTYGFGNFENPGHSIMEQQFEKIAFKEEFEVKQFEILLEQDAEELLKTNIENLLLSTRPVSDSQTELIINYVRDYNYQVSFCNNKDTTINLLLMSEDIHYCRFIKLSDVYKIVQQLVYVHGFGRNMKHISLPNQTRMLLTNVFNYFFNTNNVNILECYEKKKFFNSVLYHIHYKPVNDTAKEFVEAMSTKGNKSVYSTFEALMNKGEIKEAFIHLRNTKGNSMILRNLNYLLSRCSTDNEIDFIFENLDSNNPIVLIQLLLQYSTYKYSGKRTFKFTRCFNLVDHTETIEEETRRKSVLTTHIVERAQAKIRELLEKVYANKLGKVYVDESMKKIALPIQETTSSNGLGVLPKGSILDIDTSRVIRCFTYWQKVNDIDLSVIGIGEDMIQEAFSWQTMYSKQSDEIAYSGDETSGYNGGSEYFDIDVALFKQKYPKLKYLIFCNNVYSNIPFANCICKAGYMVRDKISSGEIYEPKTVQTSFTINSNSTFVYLFAVDLENSKIIWLNCAESSAITVAGRRQLSFLTDYMKYTEVINVYSFFKLCASEMVSTPEEAEIVVSDTYSSKDKYVIRSYEFEKLLAMMNNNFSLIK